MDADARGVSTFRRLGSFFLLSLALGVAPGPDIIFVLTQSLAHGARAGALVTLGLCTGLCFHVSLAAFGVAEILRRVPRAFSAVTWFGAAYLAYLAWLTWRGASAAGGPGLSGAETLTPLALYFRGVVMNACNPKVMLFFLALMPRFIVVEKGHVAGQFMLLGAVFALSTLLVFNAVALAGGAVSAWFADSPRAYANLQYASAVVMLALAAWIAFENVKGMKNGKAK